MFANGGSQVVGVDTGVLLILEASLGIFVISLGAEVLSPRCGRPEQLCRRMDFSLAPSCHDYFWRRFGPLDVDRFASP